MGELGDGTCQFGDFRHWSVGGWLSWTNFLVLGNAHSVYVDLQWWWLMMMINDDDYVWFFVQTITGVDWLYFVIYKPYELIFEYYIS